MNPAPKTDGLVTGRKRGAKSRLRGNAKKIMLDCFQRVGEDHQELLYQTMVNGLREGGMVSLGFLRLWADYSLQKPEQRLKVDGTVRKVIKVILPSRKEMQTKTLEAEYEEVKPVTEPALTRAAVSNFLQQAKD
jgi:hypothetical protein